MTSRNLLGISLDAVAADKAPVRKLIAAAERDPGALDGLKKLDRPIQRRLLVFLRGRVAALEDPRSISEPLSGARLGGYWKYRVGDWRIICDIQDRRIMVRVLRIGNRGDVYR